MRITPISELPRIEIQYLAEDSTAKKIAEQLSQYCDQSIKGQDSASGTIFFGKISTKTPTVFSQPVDGIFSGQVGLISASYLESHADQLNGIAFAETPIVLIQPTKALQDYRETMTPLTHLSGLDWIDDFESTPYVEWIRDERFLGEIQPPLGPIFSAAGKGFLPVQDRPLHLLKRIASVYFSEAIQLVAEGLPLDRLDQNFRALGFRKPPYQWMDQIGFDTLAQWSEQGKNEGLGIENLSLHRLRTFGWNGLSTREGFYTYSSTRKSLNKLVRMALWQDLPEGHNYFYVYDLDEAVAEGMDRILFRVINETYRCLETEPDLNPKILSLTTGEALGMLPNSGGIMQFARGYGLRRIHDRLCEMQEKFGDRFEPCVELREQIEALESNLEPSAGANRLFRKAS